MSNVYEFEMEMTCDGCAQAAKRVLAKLKEEGMKIETDWEANKVTVTSSLPSDQLFETLKKTGKPVSFTKQIS